MAFEEVERGVRELIRSVLRDKGLKHRSLPHQITPICYAQQPLCSIEYYGPISFSYRHSLITAYVYVPDKSKPPKDAVKLFSKLHRMLSYDVDFDESPSIASVKFDISDPDCDKRIGELLDKHVQDKHKRPAPHKILLRDKHAHYVPDVTIEKTQEELTRWQRFKRWWDYSRGKVSTDDTFYLSQALMRHFKLKDVSEVIETIEALRASGRSEQCIERQTKEILDQ